MVRILHSLVRLGLTAVLLSAAAAAQAVTINMVGQTFTVGYNGLVDNTLQTGLTSEANFALTDISDDRKTWTFTVSLKNTSTAPITGSRISILGFNTNPDVNRSASSVSGVYDMVETGTMPNVAGAVEICLKGAGGPNCAGGGGEGVTLGNTAQFVATLAFDNPVAALVMDGFVVRYHSIEGSSLGTSGVGFGTATAVVPLPAAAWLFISALGGLIAIGRRRRMYAATA